MAKRRKNKWRGSHKMKKNTSKSTEKKGSTSVGKCYSHEATPVLFFEKTDGALWLGALHRVESMIRTGHLTPSLVVNLSGISGHFSAGLPVVPNSVAEATLPEELVYGPELPEPAVLDVEWLDGSIPHGLTKSWWSLLAKTISETKGDSVICCHGGHGRTGVAAAIVAHILNVKDAQDDPIKFIRDTYCDHAVETKSQINYVDTMTGTKTKELPSDVFMWHGKYNDSTTAASTAAKKAAAKADGTPTVSDLFPEYEDEDEWDDWDGVVNTVGGK